MPRTDYWNSNNPDIRNSMAAMRRAAAMAREIAIQTNTEIVLVRDGKPVRVSAAELREAKGWARVSIGGCCTCHPDFKSPFVQFAQHAINMVCQHLT